MSEPFISELFTAGGRRGSLLVDGQRADTVQASEGNPNHDEHGRFAASPSVSVPPAPGASPIPKDYIRLYHYTRNQKTDAEGDVGNFQAAERLRQNGIDISKARGNSYGEPNVVWASTEKPNDQKVYAEFAVPRNDPRWRVGKPDDRQSTADYQASNQDSYFDDSINPSEIIAVHEPWHGKYRYIADHPELAADVLASKHDSLLKDTEYGPAIIKYKADHEHGPNINSPAFKKWFGNSEVIDRNGKPLVVYHGTATPNDFNEFDVDHAEIGAHFGTAKVASAFGERYNEAGRGQRVYPCYLSIQHPLQVQDPGQWDVGHVLSALQRDEKMTAEQVATWHAGFDARWKSHDWSTPYPQNKEIRELLQSHGYDGIAYINRREGITLPDDLRYNTFRLNELSDAEFLKRVPNASMSYIAIDKHQIKSATGNRGTWDGTQGDINASEQIVASEGNPNHDAHTGEFTSADTATEYRRELIRTPRDGGMRGCTIIKNPTPADIWTCILQSKKSFGEGDRFTNDARYLADRDGNIYMWPAYHGLHEDGTKYLKKYEGARLPWAIGGYVNVDTAEHGARLRLQVAYDKESPVHRRMRLLVSLADRMQDRREVYVGKHGEVAAAEFNEADHPREHGKFTVKAGGSWYNPGDITIYKNPTRDEIAGLTRFGPARSLSVTTADTDNPEPRDFYANVYAFNGDATHTDVEHALRNQDEIRDGTVVNGYYERDGKGTGGIRYKSLTEFYDKSHDAARRIVGQKDEIIGEALSEWNEAEHPREHGRFTLKSSGASSYGRSREDVDVWLNPTRDEIHRLTTGGPARTLTDNRDVYMFKGDNVIHEDMRGPLNQYMPDDNGHLWPGYYDRAGTASGLKYFAISGADRQAHDNARRLIHQVEHASAGALSEHIVASEGNPNHDEHGRFSSGTNTGVGSPAFNRWFAGSQVTTPDGRPQIVYHGSMRDITEFHTDGDPDKQGYQLLDQGIGSHFAVDPRVTDVFSIGEYVRPHDYVVDSYDPEKSWYRDSQGELQYNKAIPTLIHTDTTGHEVEEPYELEKHGYTGGVRERLHDDTAQVVLTPPGGRVYPVYLSIKHPLVVTPHEREMDQSAIGRVVGGLVFAADKRLFVDAYAKTGREHGDQVWEDLHAGREVHVNKYENYHTFEDVAQNFSGMLNGSELTLRAKNVLVRLGYDGIKYTNTSNNEVHTGDDPTCWIAFHPGQIKSASGNRGTWDERVPEIDASEEPRDTNGRWTNGGQAAPHLEPRHTINPSDGMFQGERITVNPTPKDIWSTVLALQKHEVQALGYKPDREKDIRYIGDTHGNLYVFPGYSGIHGDMASYLSREQGVDINGYDSPMLGGYIHADAPSEGGHLHVNAVYGSFTDEFTTRVKYLVAQANERQDGHAAYLRAGGVTPGETEIKHAILGYKPLGVDNARKNGYTSASEGNPNHDERGRFATGTSSPAFRAWFGRSKVVDANGKPLVMYHGTNAKGINSFVAGSHFGTADAANDRAKSLYDFSVNVVHRDPGAFHVFPVYLSIQNPLRLPDLASLNDRGEPLDESSDEESDESPRHRSWEGEGDLMETLADIGIVKDDEFWDHQYAKNGEIYKLLKDKGYDGIVYNNAVEDAGHDSYIIFDPTQVKSATGNRGTWSRDSKEINASDTEPRDPHGRWTTGGNTGYATDYHTRNGLHAATFQIPTHLNDGTPVPPATFNRLHEQLVAKFGGFKPLGIRQGYWEGQAEPSDWYTVHLAHDKLAEFRDWIHDTGKALGQMAMYVDIRPPDDETGKLCESHFRVPLSSPAGAVKAISELNKAFQGYTVTGSKDGTLEVSVVVPVDGVPKLRDSVKRIGAVGLRVHRPSVEIMDTAASDPGHAGRPGELGGSSKSDSDNTAQHPSNVTALSRGTVDHTKTYYYKQPVVDQLLGSDWTPERVAALNGTNAVDPQADAAVSTTPTGVDVRVNGHGFFSYCTYTRDGTAKVCELNDLLFDHMGTGAGTKIFTQEVQALRKAGFDRIKLVAAKGDGLVGYCVWPKFGFDAKLDTPIAGKNTIQALYATEGGRREWETHGDTTMMEFDLHEGSASMKVFNRYLAARHEHIAASDGRPAKFVKLIHNTKQRGRTEPDLSADDKAAMERVWNT